MWHDILEYDVVVAGGGSSGLAAAISAARDGFRVALIDNHSFLGGKATASQVGTICGLYLRNTEHHLNYASHGFAKEFEEKLKKRSGMQPACHTNGLWFLPYHPIDFMRLGDELTSESKVDVYFHSTLCEVVSQDSKITGLKVFAYDRILFLKPGVVIDCTGEAIVAKLANEPVIESNEYQASALVFIMEEVEQVHTTILNMSMMREIRKELDSNNLTESLSHLSLVPGSHKGSQVGIKLGMPEPVTGILNKITPLETLARERIEKVASFLTSHVNAFKHARIGSIAPEIGVRTGRRPTGRLELGIQDVLKCVKTADGIANGSWPIEQWSSANKVKMQYFPTDDYYQIPAGCLESPTIQNLYFAGRHISSSNEAIASARVIGTCLSTGFAAGKMASGYLAGTQRDEVIKRIRQMQVIL